MINILLVSFPTHLCTSQLSIHRALVKLNEDCMLQNNNNVTGEKLHHNKCTQESQAK